MITSATSTIRSRPIETTPKKEPVEAFSFATAPTGTHGPTRPMKVLFLSSDTGGGHRASAEALGKQFQLLFPGTTYDLLDVVEQGGTCGQEKNVTYIEYALFR
jgi:hypothetical protein